MTLQDYGNRLIKMQRHLKKWATRIPTDCYRVYDRDIPEMPVIVEIFGTHAVIWEKISAKNPKEIPFSQEEIIAASAQALGLETAHIHYKVRAKMPGAQQYTKLAGEGELHSVQEGPMKFLVNLYDYLDTGLFLDHRPLRLAVARGRPEAASARMLNLFCYTGCVSVAAALGGFKVTSMDMSATYLGWAEANFRHNGIASDAHAFVRANILDYLKGSRRASERFDLIFLDPPSFSNSKRMEEHLDVVEHHPQLISSCMDLLTPGGKLIFSTNKRKFKLAPAVQGAYAIEDMTARSIPQDFSDKKIHQCFAITPMP